MVDLKPLCPELQAVANKELFEVPSRIPEHLHNLKLWISQQPHLKARNDDQFLIQFLRGSKYNLNNAKERLDRYYTLKSKYPEVFQVANIESPSIQKVLSLGCFTLLPKPLNGCGPRIGIFRFNFTVPEHSMNDITRSYVSLIDVVLLNDAYTCICGVVTIIDMASFNLKHALHITPGFLKKMIAFFVKTLPIRIKAVYCINVSTVALKFVRLLLPLFPGKFKQRTFVCGNDIQELTSHLPLQYLPQDYGGENGSMDELAVECQKTLRDNANYFKENNAFGVDESLRPGKPTHFDIERSFSKLNVD